jgi:hypothetical protein
MGRLHAQAYLRLRHHYPHLPAARLIAVAGRARAVLGAEPPSLLDTLRGLAIERRIADVRIAAERRPELMFALVTPWYAW